MVYIFSSAPAFVQVATGEVRGVDSILAKTDSEYVGASSMRVLV